MTIFTAPLTAKDLMTPAPTSAQIHHTIQEVVVLMSEAKVSALPVINANGQPIGVVSQTDILRYDREKADYLKQGDFISEASFYQQADLFLSDDQVLNPLQMEQTDPTRVEDIMTPMVFSVYPDTPTPEIIAKLLEKRVHRLFVVNAENRLLGVISNFDILKHLRAEPVTELTLK